MDRQLEQLSAAARLRGLPPLPAISPDEARERIVAGNRLCADGPEVASVEEVVIPVRDGTIDVRVYRHCESPLGTLVYLHGGGWITGELGYADELLRFLARRTGLTVVSVDYRLAPEVPYPGPLDDAYAALLWAADTVADGDGLVLVGGDSAGGNLAAACAVRARDEHGPQVDLQVLLYPVLDHDFSHESYRTCANSFPLGRSDLEYCWDQYLPDTGERNSPLASPGRSADLSGLPEALIVIAGHDPLHDEGASYAQRLQAAGIVAHLHEYPELCHGFLRFTGAAQACRTARDEVVAAVGSAVRRLASRHSSVT